MPRLRHRRWISSLELHPNRAEILSICSRLLHLTEGDMARLGRAWRDTCYLIVARDHALVADTPLVLDVLAAFERVDAVFAEELTQRELFGPVVDRRSGLTLRTQVVNNARCAVHDALAAAYAKPLLAPAQYMALMAPWHRAFAVEYSG